MKTDQERIQRRYDRIAPFYDLLESPMEAAFAAWREQLLKMAAGHVLEVGVGTGKNLPYYASDISVTGIDFSREMLDRASKRAANLGIKNVTLLEMNAEDLSFFDDNSFDTIVSTCVFCSVPLPVNGLRELFRVCKPSGKVLMLEHVRSEGPVLGPLMDLLNPVPFYLYGANINRRTIENLLKAGFRHLDVTNLWHDIVKQIIARPGMSSAK